MRTLVYSRFALQDMAQQSSIVPDPGKSAALNLIQEHFCLHLAWLEDEWLPIVHMRKDYE